MLNKKLAEWAGFIPFRDSTIEYPNGDFGAIPDFTNSLDVCFPWLVPKLSYWSIGESGKDQCVGWARTTTSKRAYMATAPTPALALCLAIEKLIDEGDK